jgi:hypothetical protein
MSGKTDHVRVTTVERIDQVHLHPLLEDPRLAGNRTLASMLGGEHSSIELFEQLYELVTMIRFFYFFADKQPGICTTHRKERLGKKLYFIAFIYVNKIYVVFTLIYSAPNCDPEQSPFPHHKHE